MRIDVIRDKIPPIREVKIVLGPDEAGELEEILREHTHNQPSWRSSKVGHVNFARNILSLLHHAKNTVGEEA